MSEQFRRFDTSIRTIATFTRFLSRVSSYVINHSLTDVGVVVTLVADKFVIISIESRCVRACSTMGENFGIGNNGIAVSTKYIGN